MIVKRCFFVEVGALDDTFEQKWILYKLLSSNYTICFLWWEKMSPRGDGGGASYADGKKTATFAFK